jgi:hypothetical protein
MFLALSAPQRGQRTEAAEGDDAGAAADPIWPPIGAPQEWQKAFCGGFSRWH